MNEQRCKWVANTFELYENYHDQEWGVPVHDDQLQFEFLVLESAQAGLSWSTILKKREGYRQAFADFDVQKVAKFSEEDINKLVQNPEIIRNRAKISAAVNNARRFVEVQQEFGSFSQYIWGFVNQHPIDGQRASHGEIPATSAISDALAKDLKKRGFKFLGSTTIYAHMQATGLVNDHEISCFRYEEVKKL